MSNYKIRWNYTLRCIKCRSVIFGPGYPRCFRRLGASAIYYSAATHFACSFPGPSSVQYRFELKAERLIYNDNGLPRGYPTRKLRLKEKKKNYIRQMLVPGRKFTPEMNAAVKSLVPHIKLFGE